MMELALSIHQEFSRYLMEKGFSSAEDWAILHGFLERIGVGMAEDSCGAFHEINWAEIYELSLECYLQDYLPERGLSRLEAFREKSLLEFLQKIWPGVRNFRLMPVEQNF